MSSPPPLPPPPPASFGRSIETAARPWTVVTATALLLGCAVFAVVVLCAGVGNAYDGVLNVWLWALLFGAIALSFAAMSVWLRARGAAGVTWVLALTGLPWCAWLAEPDTPAVWRAVTVLAACALLGAAILQVLPSARRQPPQ